MRNTFFAATVFSGAILAGAALAAGGADPTPTPASGQNDAATTCPKGQVYDVKTKKCVQQKSGILPDSQLVEYAFALDKAQRYDEALGVLDLLQDQNTARALNYRGYTLRKMGHWDEGVAFYMKSIAVDPQYVQVREYLGEAYVEKGKIALAAEQLATIARLCGSKECSEYQDLSKAIGG